MNAIHDIHAHPAAKGYFVVLAAALVLYGVTAAPGLLWQDSGMIQYRVYSGDIEGEMGLALSHPLFYAIAIGVKWLMGGCKFIHAINLISAVAGALTVANCYLLLRLWLGRIMPAVMGALTLALGHTFWQHACMIETYTLYTAFFSAELIFLLKYCRLQQNRYLFALAVTNGLAVSVHMFAVIPLAVYTGALIYWAVRKQVHGGTLVLLVLSWAAGAGLYEYLIVKEWVASGDFGGTLMSAMFGKAWQGDVLNTTVDMRILQQNVLFLGLNFPTPTLLLGFVGLGALYGVSPGKVFGHCFMAITVLMGVFASRYTVVDRYAFFIPFYLLCSLFIGLGFDYVLSSVKKKRLVTLAALVLALLPIAVYAVAPQLAREAGVSLGLKREIPYRDGYAFFLRPWQWRYDGADRFAVEALEVTDNQALIYADGTTVYPLVLKQAIEGMGETITLVSGHSVVNNLEAYSEGYLAEHPEVEVYVVSPVSGYCPGFLLNRYDFERAGVVYRAVEKGQ